MTSEILKRKVTRSPAMRNVFLEKVFKERDKVRPRNECRDSWLIVPLTQVSRCLCSYDPIRSPHRLRKPIQAVSTSSLTPP